jgi:hypothetical protein
MEDYIYRSRTREQILASPAGYPWNIILRMYQFTRPELLHVRSYCDVADITRFQRAATYGFIFDNFREEVNESDLIDWEDVLRYTSDR